MLSLLIVIIALVLFVYGSLYVWPGATLWWWVQWQYRQHYRVHIIGLDHRLDDGMMMVTRTADLRIAALLKRFTALPIYCLNLSAPQTKIVRWLLKQARIEFINLEQLQKLTTPGLVLISASDYAQLPPTSALMLVDLAGINALSQTRMRFNPRDIQLTLQACAELKEPIDAALQRLSVHAWERYVDKLPSIVEAWLEHAKALGNRLSVADSTGVQLTHHRLLTSVLIMHHKLFGLLSDCDYVGLCLPNSVGGIVSVLSLLSLGKTLVNLNYTADQASLASAIHATGLKKVITSKLFVENLRKKGFPIDETLKLVTPIYLEDIKAMISKQELIKNFLLVKIMPLAFLRAMIVPPVAAHHVAFVLFSSGSEGKPKGVELTHRNLVANVRQCAQVLEAEPKDTLLSVLPIFHAFGLTAATLLPLMEGLAVVSHPDPTDTATVGMLAQQYRPTLLFGTSTFLRLYAKAKNITPDMFGNLRIVVAGAERLQPEVRSLFEQKFHKIIYEGYGTTELSPVASVNRPDTTTEVRHKIGTVGRAIVGCMFRIVDPETEKDLAIGEAGLILVGGVNVMKGYLHQPEKTHEVIMHEQDIRWYKTGDKGRLDEQGFLTILDRYSRFAKVGGESISLAAIEEQINALVQHPDVETLALTTPDARKGEMIVLLHTGPLSSDEIASKVMQSAMHNLMKPSKYLHVEHIPKLGTGKTDFATAKTLL